MADSLVPDNLLTQWARLLIGGLVELGVRRVVISPGSRSTPLVAAVLERSELERWVIIDERAAGFFAVSQAKLTGQPTLLLCTSGTAAAHYLPAVIEADECAVPLLVISADRPAWLQGCRAPQTIDQQRLFGRKVRHFVDLGPPAAGVEELRALLRQATRAVLATRFPTPGPVHVNFPAGKPLEPRAASTRAGRELEARVTELLTNVPRAFIPDDAGSASVTSACEAISQLARAARRPVCALGPTLPYRREQLDAVAALLAELGWPVWCEVSSGLRCHPRWADLLIFDAFDLWLRRPEPTLLPDFVLQLGDPLTSGAANAWFESADVPRVVVAPHQFADPQQRAELVVLAKEAVVAQALTAKLPRAKADYAHAVRDANRRVWSAVDASLRGATTFDEATACDVVSRQLEPGDLLMLGNSLTIRVTDAVLRGRADHVVASSQRGANGIDGLIAGVAGAASVHSGRCTLLLGDVSALHDLSSLAVLAHTGAAVSVVVLNNRGGRIFEHLPDLRRGAAALDHSPWTTPHDFELYKAAEVFGIRAFLAEDARDLQRALELSRVHPGPAWIEARLDSSGSVSFFERVLADLDAHASGDTGAP